MDNYKTLKNIKTEINIFYIDDNSLESNIIRCRIRNYFNIFEEYNYEKDILNKFNAQVYNLIICNIGRNIYINKYLIENLKLLSKSTLIILALPAESNLSLYDSLKVDYDIYSFDKSNVSAAVNVISNSIKYINKENTISALEDKIVEFQRLLELYNKHIIAAIADKNGIIKYVTNAYCDISHYSKNELLGNNLFDLTSSDNKINVLDIVESEQIWKGELKNVRKNKSFYWVYATFSPEYDEEHNVIGYTSIQQDISEKKYIELLSITDSLTDLFNRRHFDTLLEKEIKLSLRHKHNLNLVLLDIDFFKQYNDEYGHQKGDEALEKLSSCMKNTFKRTDDYIFRVGGEEFAILLTVDKQKDIFIIINQLQKNLEKLKIPHVKSCISSYLTISIGITKIEKYLSAKEFYKQADDALYLSKKKGRNTISIHKQNDINIGTYDI